LVNGSSNDDVFFISVSIIVIFATGQGCFFFDDTSVHLASFVVVVESNCTSTNNKIGGGAYHSTEDC
jgi:hypothetical protein